MLAVRLTASCRRPSLNVSTTSRSIPAGIRSAGVRGYSQPASPSARTMVPPAGSGPTTMASSRKKPESPPLGSLKAKAACSITIGDPGGPDPPSLWISSLEPAGRCASIKLSTRAELSDRRHTLKTLTRCGVAIRSAGCDRSGRVPGTSPDLTAPGGRTSCRRTSAAALRAARGGHHRLPEFGPVAHRVCSSRCLRVLSPRLTRRRTTLSEHDNSAASSP